MLSHEDLMGASVLIFANKQDLQDALTVEELTEKLCLHTIKTHDWHIQSCCATTGGLLFAAAMQLTCPPSVMVISAGC